MSELTQLRTLMETFSDTKLRNLPGANRKRPTSGELRQLSPEEKKAQYDAWVKKGEAKRAAKIEEDSDAMYDIAWDNEGLELLSGNQVVAFLSIADWERLMKQYISTNNRRQGPS